METKWGIEAMSSAFQPNAYALSWLDTLTLWELSSDYHVVVQEEQTLSGFLERRQIKFRQHGCDTSRLPRKVILLDKSCPLALYAFKLVKVLLEGRIPHRHSGIVFHQGSDQWNISHLPAFQRADLWVSPDQSKTGACFFVILLICFSQVKFSLIWMPKYGLDLEWTCWRMRPSSW